jgi:hypothetical protein
VTKGSLPPSYTVYGAWHSLFLATNETHESNPIYSDWVKHARQGQQHAPEEVIRHHDDCLVCLINRCRHSSCAAGGHSSDDWLNVITSLPCLAQHRQPRMASPNDSSLPWRAPLGRDGLGPGAWDVPIRHFCESSHQDGPEYWSAFSSLFITLVGLVGLFRGRHSNSLVKLCFAVLAWCGLGSFAFHWTRAEAWSFFDTFPMTVAAVLGVYLGLLAMIRVVVGRTTTPPRQASR